MTEAEPAPLSVKDRLKLFEANASSKSNLDLLSPDVNTSPASVNAAFKPLTPSPASSRSVSPSLKSSPVLAVVPPPKLPARKPSSPAACLPSAPLTLSKPQLPPRKQATVPVLQARTMPPLPPRPQSLKSSSSMRSVSLSDSPLKLEPEIKTRPVDPRARKRYEALFDRQTRLMERDSEDLPGSVVAVLWKRSKLPFSKLKEIWSVARPLRVLY
jgi:hypothetical protein